MGVVAQTQAIAESQNVPAYQLTLYNLGCTPGVRVEQLELMVAPQSRPEIIRDMHHDDVFVVPGGGEPEDAAGDDR